MQVVLSGTAALSAWKAEIERLAVDAPTEMVAALNVVGPTARKAMVRVEAKQIGLPVRTLERALKAEPASWGSLDYKIRSAGGNISLKYFKPVESGNGVTVTPWGVPVSIQGGFIKGGRPGARVPIPSLNGHVYRRIGSGRKIERVNSDAFIPVEMLKGATLKVAEDSIEIVGAIAATRIARLLS